jgi:type IV pilus assembly protein PilE
MMPRTDKPTSTRFCHGFTLVELMVVLAIVMILAKLAFAGYTGFIVKARRVEAQSALLMAMQDQERYYSQFNTYLAFSASQPGNENMRVQWWLGASPRRSAYELSGQACEQRPLQSCIELRAQPGTGLVDPSFRDPECEMLTLDSTGRHGAGGRQTGCWP